MAILDYQSAMLTDLKRASNGKEQKLCTAIAGLADVVVHQIP